MASDKEIKKMYDAKMARFDRQSESILISWAINNAVQCMSEEHKNENWETQQELIRSMYPFFIKLYKEYFKEQEPKPLSDWEIENGQEKFNQLSAELDLKTDVQRHEAERSEEQNNNK